MRILRAVKKTIPFPENGITFLGGFPDGGEPTTVWIGKPSEKDIELFLWFLFSNVASRPRGAGRHQTRQIEGTLRAYGKPTSHIRGSDLSLRIYAGVRLLEITGKTNKEACATVATFLCERLGASKRGRPRNTDRERDSIDRMQTVRSLYNTRKKCHRWPEKLPQRDLELEDWWGSFLNFRDRANKPIKRTRRKRASHAMTRRPL